MGVSKDNFKAYLKKRLAQHCQGERYIETGMDKQIEYIWEKGYHYIE
jgi:hypothetical protein